MTVPPALDDRPVALVFRSPLFNRSEIFIQRQAAGVQEAHDRIKELRDSVAYAHR